MMKEAMISAIILLASIYTNQSEAAGETSCSTAAQRREVASYISCMAFPGHNIFRTDKGNKAAEIPEAGIKLSYVKKVDGMCRGFVLQIKNGKRYFSWENTANPSHAPQLMLSDLDGDGKEELAILLTKGYGTGVHDTVIHVIRQDRFLSEILVENPEVALHKNVRLKELEEDIKIIINKDKIITLDKKKILSSPYSKVGIGFSTGNVRFEVKGNTLNCRVPVVVNTIDVGELIARYKYQDEIYQVENIDFYTYRDYKTEHESMDLWIKSNCKVYNPFGDDSDVNKVTFTMKPSGTIDEIINTVISVLFDKYKKLDDPDTAIADYKIYKTDKILETKEGAVFGILYSVRGIGSQTRWHSTGWIPAQKLICSYIREDDKYTLNIIGEKAIYYNGPGNNPANKEMAKILFEKEYLYPRLFDESYGKDTTYNIEEAMPLKEESTFTVKYSVNGRPWIFADEEKRIAYGNCKLMRLGDFYEIELLD